MSTITPLRMTAGHASVDSESTGPVRVIVVDERSDGLVDAFKLQTRTRNYVGIYVIAFRQNPSSHHFALGYLHRSKSQLCRYIPQFRQPSSSSIQLRERRELHTSHSTKPGSVRYRSSGWRDINSRFIDLRIEIEWNDATT